MSNSKSFTIHSHEIPQTIQKYLSDNSMYPPAKGDLSITFDGIENADLLVGDASNVEDWNQFFMLPFFGTPFKFVSIIEDTVTLSGGQDIRLRPSLFGNQDALSNTILEINDQGCIIEVGYDCFGDEQGYGCGYLTSVTMLNCRILSSYAFNYCWNLETMNFPSLIIAGDSCFEDFCYNTSFNMPLLLYAGDSCFRGSEFLNVSLPSLKFAGDYCFRGNDIVSIDIPKVEQLGMSAFYNCVELKSIECPLLTSLPDNCFQGCSALETITLPLVTSLGEDCFYGCDALETINLPLIESLEHEAFRALASLTTINIPNLKTVGDSCFYQCTAVETFDFPKLETAGSQAFVYCTALTEIDFPLLTSIGTYCFTGCNHVVSVDLPELQAVPDYAFMNLAASTTFNLPLIESVGNNSFANCEGLETLDFELLETIAAGAFSGCSALVTIDLPALLSVGNGSFVQCAALEIFNTPLLENLGTSTDNNNVFDNIEDNEIAMTVPAALLTCYNGVADRDIQALGELNTLTVNNVLYDPKNYLQLTMNVYDTSMTDPTLVADWNTFFNLPANGNPFTSVVVTPTVAKLYGGSGITLHPTFNHASDFYKFEDFCGCIVAVAAQGLHLLNKLMAVDLHAAETIGDECFDGCSVLTSIDLSACTALGSTTGDDDVFNGITGKNIQLLVPPALLTCNSNQPDGDIQYLTNNNTVFINGVPS
ncbi:MAG: leucine-rich repeat protein [Ferruginibacter sp.]